MLSRHKEITLLLLVGRQCIPHVCDIILNMKMLTDDRELECSHNVEESHYVQSCTVQSVLAIFADVTSVNQSGTLIYARKAENLNQIYRNVGSRHC